jgi:hypothetical protein
MNINTARTLANIVDRAKTLFQTGYTFEKNTNYPESYVVENLAGALYFVNIKHETCTCEAFEHFDACKHLLAVKEEVRRDDAMCAAFEENEFGRFAMESDAAEHFIAA